MKIKSKEFSIIDNKTEDSVLYTTYLGSELAFSFHIESENKGGLARNLNANQIKQLFQELNPEQKSYKAELHIVGGDISQESISYTNMLTQTLEELQKNGYTFEIEMKVNGDLHPDFIFFEL